MYVYEYIHFYFFVYHGRVMVSAFSVYLPSPPPVESSYSYCTGEGKPLLSPEKAAMALPGNCPESKFPKSKKGREK